MYVLSSPSLKFQYFWNFISIYGQNSVKILTNPYTWRHWAYKQGLTWPKYAWILHSYRLDDLLQNSTSNKGCMHSVQKSFEGFLSFSWLMKELIKKLCITGTTILMLSFFMIQFGIWFHQWVLGQIPIPHHHQSMIVPRFMFITSWTVEPDLLAFMMAHQVSWLT